jgi:hypothetical protein
MSGRSNAAMLETNSVFEKLVHLHHLTWLSAGEDFIDFFLIKSAAF